jgi:uncharacterized heparinase superfamily protein
MKKINLYFNTIKKLSVEQIYYRLLFYSKRKFIHIYNLIFEYFLNRYLSRTKNKANRNIDNYTYVNKNKYTSMNESDILKYKFTFLNKTLQFKEGINWNIDEADTGTRLWTFHLHYLEYLVDLSKSYSDDLDKDKMSFIKSTIRDWSISNPLNSSKSDYAAWSRYSVSTRLISLIRINYFLYKANYDDKEFLDLLNSLIAKHAFFVKNNLELDILGNHIIRNYKALIFASIFLKDRQLMSLANQIFNKHIKNQFDVKSGMHNEQSPMYASIVAEDLMDVYLLTNTSRLKNIISKLSNCLSRLSVNDQYYFFNDCVENFAPKNSYIQEYQKFLGIESNKNIVHADINGIVIYPPEEDILDDNNNVRFAVNCSNLNMQDGHYHCSNLSFELFLKDKKIFTNSGVYGYSNSHLRNEFRSTSYHNTLQYKDLEQSQIWSLFRVGLLAKSTHHLNKENTNFDWELDSLVAHYSKVCHSRKMKLSKKSGKCVLDIWDKVLEDRDGSSKVFFHLYPSVITKIIDDYSIEIKNNNEDTILFKSNQKIDLRTTHISKEFGLLDNKKTIVLKNSSEKNTFQSKIIF